MNVFVLVIAYEEGDWKSRYGAEKPKIHVFDSLDKCYDELKKIVVGKCSEKFCVMDINEVPEHIQDWFVFNDDNTDWTFKSSKEGFPLEQFYEWVSEGEYVPNTWTYSVVETTVL